MAHDLWPRLGALLSSSDTDSNDKSLILMLLPQCAPDARCILREVVDTVRSGEGCDGLEGINAILAVDRDLVLRELEAMTNDKSAAVREDAGAAIGLLAVDPQAALPVLSRLLGNPDPVIRGFAAQGLGGCAARMRNAFSGIEPAIVDAALVDRDAKVRGDAMTCLQIAGLQSPEGIGRMAEVLHGGPCASEADIETTIQFMGRYGEGLVPVVKDMLVSKSPVVRKWGVLLDRCGCGWTREGILPRIRRAAEDADPAVRNEAVRSLAVLEGKN